MPTYDYYCEANGQTLEVRHKMSEQIATWGELCELTGREIGDIDANSPVKRLATGGQVVNRGSLGSGQAPACESGGCCGGGMCGLN